MTICTGFRALWLAGSAADSPGAVLTPSRRTQPAVASRLGGHDAMAMSARRVE